MIKFTKVIENLNNQKRFKVTTEVIFYIDAETEGDAGYNTDSIFDDVDIEYDYEYKINDVSEI